MSSHAMHGLNSFWLNILLMALWHLLVFLICINIKTSNFSADKPMYRCKDWEKNGKWYKTHLRINLWKDALPQHVGKDGFSKRHLVSLSPDYIEQFILETCRAEWNHRINCLFFIIAFMVNSLIPAIFFSLVTILLNIPFIIIQRYNRFRLLSLKNRLSKAPSSTDLG